MRTQRENSENLPSTDYVDRILRSGPREGESTIAFVKRVAALRAARDYAFAVWKLVNRNKVKFAERLGITLENAYNQLTREGLSYEVLDEMLKEETDIGFIK